MKNLENFRSADVNDLANNPEKYGVPSWSDYKKNPDKYSLDIFNERVFAELDNGASGPLRSYIRTHIYYIKGYKCRTLTEVEKISCDYGISKRDLVYIPKLRNMYEGKADLTIWVMDKAEKERRDRAA
jgi:hypothetical protein